MNHRPSAIAPLLTVLTLLVASACDPASELDDLEQDLAPELSGPDDLVDANDVNLQQTVWCDLGLPDTVMANPAHQGTAVITTTGLVNNEYYHFRSNFGSLKSIAVRSHVPPNAVYYEDAYLGPMISSFLGWHGLSTFDLTMTAYPLAPSSSTYDVEIQLYITGVGYQCSDYVTMLLPHSCGPVGAWSTGPAPSPWYDGVNCYVTNLPPGAKGFVWSNNWYVKPTNGNQCSIGAFDGANCFIGAAPAGHTAFVWDGNIYFKY